MSLEFRKIAAYAALLFAVGLALLLPSAFDPSSLLYAAGLFEQDASDAVSSHTAAKEYVWYCLPARDSCQPLPTEKAKFIKDYPVLYVGNPDEKVIYLTFDDGVDDSKINRILDALLLHDAPAAFFLNEAYIREYPKTIRRMALEGHLVCNHTNRHIRISSVSSLNQFRDEISGVEKAYKEATGMEAAKYFRPPGGRFSELTLRFAQKLGYTTVFWSYCYIDWQQGRQPVNPKTIEAILARTHNGEIILLHTQSETNVEILGTLLDRWTAMGYSFRSLDSLSPSASPAA